MARDMHEETFGSGSRRANHDFAQKTMGEHYGLTKRLERLDRQIVDLRAKLAKAGQKSSPELGDLVEQADHTRNDLARANDIYWQLAVEIDARRAGYSAEAAFQRILDADILLGMAEIKIRKAGKDLEALQGGDEKAILQVKAILVAAQKEHDELQRLAALLPKPAGATK
jgi:hypothetical protein